MKLGPKSVEALRLATGHALDCCITGATTGVMNDIKELFDRAGDILENWTWDSDACEWRLGQEAKKFDSVSPPLSELAQRANPPPPPGSRAALARRVTRRLTSAEIVAFADRITDLKRQVVEAQDDVTATFAKVDEIAGRVGARSVLQLVELREQRRKVEDEIEELLRPDQDGD